MIPASQRSSKLLSSLAKGLNWLMYTHLTYHPHSSILFQSNKMIFALIIASFFVLSTVNAFTPSSSVSRRVYGISMEYIPDGLTKDQWKALKAKEAEEARLKANGALGTTKFKSRSFEAWHKAGAKHLFPVNPNEASYEERPYMQRKDGDWEGNDLKKLGLKGKGQGEARQRLKVDDLYDDAATSGKLNSASFWGGKGLPWTNKQANELKTSFNPEGKQGTRGVAGKKLSPEEMERLKANLVKPVVSKKTTEVAAATTTEAPKKKFGFF